MEKEDIEREYWCPKCGYRLEELKKTNVLLYLRLEVQALWKAVETLTKQITDLREKYASKKD